MYRLISSVFLALFLLSACDMPAGGDGNSGRIYKIRASDTARIQFKVLDSVNALRAASGQPALELDSRLNAAAATHSRDMSSQKRPWHFGSDGSSPLERVRRAGYTGEMLGENISESFEGEVETVSAWIAQPDTRAVLMEPRARNLGISWYQETGGKIWWTLLTGS